MELMTKVALKPSDQPITYDDRILMVGSCFSDEVARKLGECYFRVDANPFGTLYNPVSILHHLADEVLSNYSVVIVTFGTAWVYVDRATNKVVDNCRKRPASDFIRQRLTTDEIVAAWRPLVEQHPEQRFIFTVSPIRHVKDGLHENDLSKAILLLAIEQLTNSQQPIANSRYFPSYEILLDELRDYRFYAEDLKHPSAQAVNYIFERFAETYLYTPETKQTMNELHALWLDKHHRLLNPDSPEAEVFMERTNNKFIELSKRYPWISEHK